MAKPNAFVRAWKYFGTWFGVKLDERADPKVQIQQAIEEAQRNHAALTRQAANVIGNQRQLEMKLDRQLNQIETLQSQARQALVLADKTRGDGDAAKAAEFEQTAQALANQLVTAESSIEDLKALHDQSFQAATQAREAVASNAMMLEKKLAERTQLLTQLEQAKMQESVSASLQQMSEMAAPSNVPSLEEVRDKIEKRYATALGAADLAEHSVAGRMLEVQRASADLQGSARLAEIRASLNASANPTPALESSAPVLSAKPANAAAVSGRPPQKGAASTEGAVAESTQAATAESTPEEHSA